MDAVLVWMWGIDDFARTHSDALPFPAVSAGFVLDPHLPHLRNAPIRALALVKLEHDRRSCAAAAMVLPEDGEEEEGGEEGDEYDEEAEEERRGCGGAGADACCPVAGAAGVYSLSSEGAGTWRGWRGRYGGHEGLGTDVAVERKLGGRKDRALAPFPL
jgi:hypothetical protein